MPTVRWRTYAERRGAHDGVWLRQGSRESTMTFQENIARIKSGIVEDDGADTTGASAGQLVHRREAVRMFDVLGRQFNEQLGPSVICLPMSPDDSDGIG